MAKTLTKEVPSTAYEMDINSKDTVWTFTVANKVFKLKPKNVENEYIKIGYAPEGCTVGIREGNDLVIYTSYQILKNNKTKTIKNTLKDYYTTPAAAAQVYKVNGETFVDIEQYTQSTGVATAIQGGDTKFYGTKKNDVYNLRSYSDEAIVYDEKGNDKYYTLNDTDSVIYDLAGSDYYNVTEESSLYVKDYAGNDKYVVDDKNSLDGSEIESYDYAGNDSYTIKNAEGITIYDEKGSDKYQLYSNTEGGYTIRDLQGNDIYEVNNTKSLTINEIPEGIGNNSNKSGNDKYNITGSSAIVINEKSSKSGNDIYNLNSLLRTSGQNKVYDNAGNDKYNIAGSEYVLINEYTGLDKYNIDACHDISIYDEGGKDNYIISASQKVYIEDDTSTSGNDKYTVKEGSMDVKITDTSGNETYSVSDSVNVYISDNDFSSNDKYTFVNVYNSNSIDYYIGDASGNDTYNITDCTDIKISDRTLATETSKIKEKNTFNIKNSTFNIIANDGYIPNNPNMSYTSSNTYNITQSSGSITDKGRDNDTYKVDKLNGALEIADYGGDKDKMIISASKADDLVFMAGYVEQSSTYILDSTLYIYDKKNGGYAAIDYWFTTTGSSLNDKNIGTIESIKASGKEVTGNIDLEHINTIINTTTVSSLGDSLKNWMKNDTREYTSIADVLESGNTNDINALIAAFTPQLV